MMNRLFRLISAGLLLTVAGCSHDAQIEDPQIDTGRPILFGANSDATRVTVGEATDGVVPLYWTDGDAVRVACTKATPRQAVYGVTCKGGQAVEAALQCTDGLRWGEGLHDFYAFSPADASGLEIAGNGMVKVTLPSVQECRGGVFDTDLLYMAAAETKVASGVSSVKLHFRPIVTLLDISFEVSEPTEVRQVVVRSAKSGEALAGTFTYDLNANTLGTVVGASDGVTVRMSQADGTPGVRLLAGQTCRVMAVLMGRESFDGVRIDVVTAGGVAGRDCRRTLFGGRRYAIPMGTLPAMNESMRSRFYGSWMTYLPDDALLSALSIPGTHDAATSSITGITRDFSRCQSLTIKQQLAIGVRCFDLRPTGTSDLMIYHGASTGVTFDAAVAAMDSYLRDYPGEGCIVQMQFQSDKGDFGTWSRVMGGYLNSSGAYRDRFVAFRPRMTLGDLRGKILILSRSSYDGALVGGKIASWQDDVTDQTSSIVGNAEAATLYIQDKYGATTGRTAKSNAVDAYFDKARSKDDAAWLFNFTSLAGLPYLHADALNPKACEYIVSHPGCTGVVMMDFAGNASYDGDRLVRAVIDQNYYYHLPCAR